MIVATPLSPGVRTLLDEPNFAHLATTHDDTIARRLQVKVVPGRWNAISGVALP